MRRLWRRETAVSKPVASLLMVILVVLSAVSVYFVAGNASSLSEGNGPFQDFIDRFFSGGSSGTSSTTIEMNASQSGKEKQWLFYEGDDTVKVLVYVKNTKGETLQDVQAEIRFDSSIWPEGYNFIGVVNESNNPVPFWLERWNVEGKDNVVWIKIDSIGPYETKQFYLVGSKTRSVEYGNIADVMIQGAVFSYYQGTNFDTYGGSGIDTKIYHYWLAGKVYIAHDYVSVRWFFFFVPPKADVYNVKIDTDDGVRLYVDEDIVLDKWYPQSSVWKLSIGVIDRPTRIVLEWYENKGDAYVAFYWKNSETDYTVMQVPQIYTISPNSLAIKSFTGPEISEEYRRNVYIINTCGKQVFRYTVEITITGDKWDWRFTPAKVVDTNGNSLDYFVWEFDSIKQEMTIFVTVDLKNIINRITIIGSAADCDFGDPSDVFILYDNFTSKNESLWNWPSNWIIENGYAKQTLSWNWHTGLKSVEFDAEVLDYMGVEINVYGKSLGTHWAYDFKIAVTYDDGSGTIKGANAPLVTISTDYYHFFSKSKGLSVETRNWHTYTIRIYDGYQEWYLDGKLKDTDSRTIKSIKTVELNGKGQVYFDWIYVRKILKSEPLILFDEPIYIGTLTIKNTGTQEVINPRITFSTDDYQWPVGYGFAFGIVEDSSLATHKINTWDVLLGAGSVDIQVKTILAAGQSVKVDLYGLKGSKIDSLGTFESSLMPITESIQFFDHFYDTKNWKVVSGTFRIKTKSVLEYGDQNRPYAYSVLNNGGYAYTKDIEKVVLEMRLKRADWVSHGVTLSFADSSGRKYVGLCLHETWWGDPDVVRIYGWILDDNGTSQIVEKKFSSPSQIAGWNVWFTITLEYYPSTRTLTLYKNGVVIAQLTLDVNPTIIVAERAQLGKNWVDQLDNVYIDYVKAEIYINRSGYGSVEVLYTLSSELTGEKKISQIMIENKGTKDLTDVQIPITLNDSNWDWNYVIYDIRDETQSIPYFVETWDANNREAVIWIKISIPSGATRILTVYGTKVYSSQCFGDPRSVFIFYEDFETWNGWTKYGSGVLSQDSSKRYDGKYSAHKTSYNDPNGAYKDIGVVVGRDIIFECYIYRNPNYAGGASDRVGLIDNSGNGYGFMYDHGKDMLGIDKRTGYGASVLKQASTLEYIGCWYKAVFIILSDGTIKSELYFDGRLIKSVSVKDTSYNTFTRVYIFGGYDYWIDHIIVRKYYDESSVIATVTLVNP